MIIGNSTVWIDLSLPVFNGSPVFPGQPSPILFPWTTLEFHPNATTAFFMIEHTGTHLDGPSHFVPHAPSIDQIPVDHFCGRCHTIDISALSAGSLSETQLKLVIKEQKIEIERDDIVLLHTGVDRRYGKEGYFENYVGVSAPAAQFLVDQKIKGVGIDAPSIDHAPYDAHRIFLPSGIIIYEFLTNLDQLVGRKTYFFGFPLKFEKCTGSPIRAVAALSPE